MISYPRNKLTSIKTATIVSSSILIALAGYTTFVGIASAETGTGTDVFKVILTILGADKVSSGDVVAIVTVNDHSKVKFFGIKGDGMIGSSPNMSSSSVSPGEGGVIEYVATFPNVTVDSGDVYNACALPLKTLKIQCVEGNNSPATRPEVVDLTLGSSPSDSVDTADSGVDSESNQSSLSSSSDDESE